MFCLTYEHVAGRIFQIVSIVPRKNPNLGADTLTLSVMYCNVHNHCILQWSRVSCLARHKIMFYYNAQKCFFTAIHKYCTFQWSRYVHCNSLEEYCVLQCILKSITFGSIQD